MATPSVSRLIGVNGEEQAIRIIIEVKKTAIMLNECFFIMNSLEYKSYVETFWMAINGASGVSKNSMQFILMNSE